MKIFNITQIALATLGFATLLAGCGDSTNLGSGVGSGTPPPALVAGTNIPISATTSSAGATDFIKSIVAAGVSETAEPLEDGNAVLAVSDSDDPDSSV